MKPLSPKTLEKMYAGLGISPDTADLLHRYFLCFSNLYGVIFVRDAWNVFRDYEGTGLLHKKDFLAFSGIVQREPGHPYAVIELKEAYSGETTEDPADRLIVNGRLIGSGYGKYALLYATEEKQAGKPYWLPERKEDFLANTEDRFFLSREGKEMVRFLSGLRTDGRYRDWEGKPKGVLLDLDGRPVAGKRLPEFALYTRSEQSDIEYFKSGAKKERLRREYAKTALEKVLDRIFTDLQTGGVLPDRSPGMSMQILLDLLCGDLGVSLTKAQAERLIGLYAELNNRSHLWLNRGWRPDEMGRGRRPGLPERLEAGPGLKKLMEQDPVARAEFERKLADRGIALEED